MAASDSAPRPIPALLREALAERGWSVRGFARRLVGPDATDKKLESRRRLLHRYLSGEVTPEPDTARELATVLGTDPELFVIAAELQPSVPELLTEIVESIEALAEELRGQAALPALRDDLKARDDLLRQDIADLRKQVAAVVKSADR